jgi:hypothetical protein
MPLKFCHEKIRTLTRDNFLICEIGEVSILEFRLNATHGLDVQRGRTGRVASPDFAKALSRHAEATGFTVKS